jgi:hypothetical protein
MKNLLQYLLIPVVVASLVEPVWAGGVFEGRVVDIASGRTKGIEGVLITIQQPGGPVIGRATLTDSDGHYKISDPSLIARHQYIATYRKVNYVENPLVRKVTNMTGPQPPVGMAATVQNPAYFASLADSVVAEKSEDIRRANLVVVSALPGPELAAVTDSLRKSGDQGLIADLSHAIEQQSHLAAFREKLVEQDLWHVYAGIDVATGKIDVLGFVGSDDDQKKVTTFAKEVQEKSKNSIDVNTEVRREVAGMPGENNFGKFWSPNQAEKF